jgi:hypothetical protein
METGPEASVGQQSAVIRIDHQKRLWQISREDSAIHADGATLRIRTLPGGGKQPEQFSADAEHWGNAE